MNSVHILRTPCYYIAQTRRVGCRNWNTVSKTHYKHAENALATAVEHMTHDTKRARALMVCYGETGQWYEPTVAMEAKRL